MGTNGIVPGLPGSKVSSKLGIWALVLALWAGLAPLPAFAQDQKVLTEVADATLERMEKVEALRAIESSMAAVREKLVLQERVLARARTDEDREAASASVEELRARLAGLDEDFTRVATGIDSTLFQESEQEEFDWREELDAVFEPVVREIRSAAAHPREVERLRADLALYERRIPEIEQGLAQLEELSEAAEDPAIRVRLEPLTDYWTQRLSEQMTQLEAARLQLDEKLSEKRTVGETVGDVFRIFFRTRGRNLVLAVVAFFAIFFLLRWLQRFLHSSTPMRRLDRSRFLARLLDVVYYLFTIVAATVALLTVLYLSGDWVLLALAVLFLVALAWTMKNTLPAFLDQARLMLNLGPVREGERVTYQGVPWRVSSLNLYTDLNNPELEGGRFRLPLRDIAALRSRPFDESKELWFPTRRGDWVVLADGFYGQVVRQTPEEVVIATGRGSEKSYRTGDFLGQRPKNLSIATFSVNRPLLLSYDLGDRALDEIPEMIKATVEEAIASKPYADCLQVVITELKELGDHGLLFNVIAKFTGGAASEYTEIGWLLAQAGLEASRRHGWEIPYPQITVHGAGER